MIHLKIKVALFSLLAVFTVSVFMISCEQENLEDTIGNIELNEEQMPIGERIINEYMEQKQEQLDVEVRQKGSQAYLDFLFEVSMGDYPDLTGEASNYIKSPEELNAVIDFIIKERAPLYENYPIDGDPSDREAEKIEEEDDSRNHLKGAGYDRNKAKDYAMKWAHDRNDNYPDFSGFGAGGDCTNFVSQAIQAGGIGMVGSGDGCKYEANNSEWYTHRGGGWNCWGAESDWEWSTPWAVPYPFRVYHRDKGNAEELGWTRSAATADALLDVGDVVQIQKDWGNGWITGHVMIVTEDIHEDLRVTYHSTDTKNKKLSEIPLGERRFQLVRFR